MTEPVCSVCGGAGKRDVKAWRQLGLEAAPRPYSIWHCRGCDLRWLAPYPQPEDYQQLYGADYFEAPVGNVGPYAEAQLELATFNRQKAARFLTLGVNGSLLDVGCGPGNFLLAARDAGLAAEGYEPSAFAADKARRLGLAVSGQTLEERVADGRQYGAVHCSHVLEHVPDARMLLADIHRLLAPGGVMYLEVPLQFLGLPDLVARLRRKSQPYSDFSIHHHYFFSPSALHRLLTAGGFEVLSLATFVAARRAARPPGARKWLLQGALWLADRLARRGDVISVWARQRP